MENRLLDAVKNSLHLPEDITISPGSFNVRLGYFGMKVNYGGNYLPAVLIFRIGSGCVVIPHRLDVYSKNVESFLEELLLAQDGTIDYNMALSISFPCYNHALQHNKLRRLIKAHVVL